MNGLAKNNILYIRNKRNKRERGNGRVRASGGSSQGVELVRASEWVVASVGAERHIVAFCAVGGR